MLAFDFFSPEEPLLFAPFQDQGYEVYIKRDDLIHPFISGNKWRKLKYVVSDAVEQNKRHLVTFGGAWSNHLLATAAAAARFGLKATGYVRGEPVENPVLHLCRLFGMELRFTDRTSYRDKVGLFEAAYGADPDAYLIHEGGAGPLALPGCAEIITELQRSYDHLFCACGTGTTLAGLSMGLRQQGLITHLHGVSVLKGGDFLKEDIRNLYPEAAPFTLHTDYHAGGYAKTSPDLNRFIQTFVSATGVLIEPVYTGKMMYALSDLIHRGAFEPGARILVLHTGGLTGILGKIDFFN